MDTQNITLLSFGHFEKEFLARLAASVAMQYNIPVNIEENYKELSEFYDPARRQYDGNKLIKEIYAQHSSDSQKKIGLFRVDLFIPILTFIFGQAFLSGSVGIASLYRLKNELYGMDANENLLLERFEKVIIHELGHCFGLKHCHTTTCVMISSTYVEDIDQKKAQLCGRCRTELGLI